MEVDKKNFYEWAMLQSMPDGDFEWLSDAECRVIKHPLINVITQYKIFSLNRSYIFEVNLDYCQEQNERDDDYPMAPKLMTIKAEIIGKKQHNLRAKYIGAACPFTRKLVSTLLPNKNYEVLGQLLVLYLASAMRLVNLHRAI